MCALLHTSHEELTGPNMIGQAADMAAGTVRERSFRDFLAAGGAAMVSALELDIVSCTVCLSNPITMTSTFSLARQPHSHAVAGCFLS